MIKYFASVASVVLGILALPCQGSNLAVAVRPPAGKIDVPVAVVPSVVFITSDGTTHTVQNGETLWGITRKYGVPYGELVKLNKIATGGVLRIGQKLRLPGKRQAARARTSKEPSGYIPYRVRSGETLFAIARRHGVSLNAIRAANKLASTELLQVGQTLQVPRYGRQSKSTPVIKQQAKRKSAKTSTRQVSQKPGTVPKGFAHYVAQPGDTAVSISKRYRLSKEALLRINGRSSNPSYTPRPGELVLVPTDGGWYEQQPSSRQPIAKRIAPQTRRVTPAPQPRRSSNPAKRIWAQHTVAPNDTLEALARHFRVTVDQIRLDNPGIRSNRDLRVGSDLKIRIGSL